MLNAEVKNCRLGEHSAIGNPLRIQHSEIQDFFTASLPAAITRRMASVS
jgi:hypothetical protein